MKYKIISLIIFMCTIANVFAEEAETAVHHEPSILDLKYPVLNFVVLVAFVIWKAKKPIEDMFNKNAENIKGLMESAEKQSKDAATKLEAFEHKIKNIDSELVKITNEYETDVVNFAKLQKEEAQTTAARMKKDIASKLEGEKNEMSDSLEHEVLQSVIAKTQVAISANNDLKKKATNNLIMGIK